MKRILQIDGGGIMGIMPAMVLTHLEKYLFKKHGKRLYQLFDLITGSSTGAIIGGTIAAGGSAESLLNLYIDRGKWLFTKKNQSNPFNWFSGKYDRGRFIQVISEIKNVDNKNLTHFTLADLKTRFMATAFNLCSQRTHFIKSWNDKDEDLNLVDVVSWSALSAMYYFGKIDEPNFKWNKYNIDYRKTKTETGAVFQDGGQGAFNNTIDFILAEILANSWEDDDDVYILSLGTGGFDRYIPYKKARGIDFIDQIIQFPFQARNESITNQVLSGQYVSRINPRIKFKRINKFVCEEEDGLDKVQYIDKYVQYGKELCGKLDDSDYSVFE